MRFGDVGMIPNFVKGLLAGTYIPTIMIWESGQPVFENRIYINGRKIIKANKTSSDSSDVPYSVQSTWVDALGKLRKWFDVVDDYLPDKHIPGVTQKYVSKTARWSREDQICLGNYCRHYKAITGIDIMPAYNCWDGGEMQNAGLYQEDDGTIYCAEAHSGLKVFTVPVKPYNTYTIMLECPTEVMLAVALTSKGNFISDTVQETTEGYRYPTYGTGACYPKMSVYVPEKITIGSEVVRDTMRAYNLIDYLTLLIQVPQSTNRLYVIEGDYTTQVKEYAYGVGEAGQIVPTEEKKNSKLTISAKSMLTPYLACPDRLIEYLSGHPITWGQFDASIASVQKIITGQKFKRVTGVRYQKDYKEGQWDEDIRRFIKWIFDKPFGNHNMVPEQMGDVVKEIERYLAEVEDV